MATPRTYIFSAILAAAFYALNAPLSKWLLAEVPPAMMAALLLMAVGTWLASTDQ